MKRQRLSVIRRMAQILTIMAAVSAGGCFPALAWTPPGTQFSVVTYGAKGNGVADDTAAILRTVVRAGNGNTVIFPPGTYKISQISLSAGVYLYAPTGATIVGNILVPTKSVTINGLTFKNTVDISTSQSATIGRCTFNGSQASIIMHNAISPLVINNNFVNNLNVGSIYGWAVDQAKISGNHFTNCLQCISLDFVNDHTRGRNIIVERNIFSGVRRMPLEVGPLQAYTLNLIVRNNWANNFNNQGPDPGQTMSTFVAYSIVPTVGVNSTITNNYADAGTNGHGRIGVELAGSGTITGNNTRNFDFGAIVYSAGFKVQNNNFAGVTQATVLNPMKLSGTISNNTSNMGAAAFAQPTRLPWP